MTVYVAAGSQSLVAASAQGPGAGDRVWSRAAAGQGEPGSWTVDKGQIRAVADGLDEVLIEVLVTGPEVGPVTLLAADSKPLATSALGLFVDTGETAVVRFRVAVRRR